VNVLIRRFRRFRREAEAVAMIAVVRTMDFMGRRVADAMVMKERSDWERKDKGGKGTEERESPE
jgi:hypothetical protein